MLSTVLLLAPLGCTKKDDANPFPNGDSRPLNTGATCDDGVGDLSKEAKSLGGNMTQPIGVDIVHAEAKLTDSTMKVVFKMAGPVEGAAETEFILAQGLPSEETGFELRAAPGAAPGQPWTLRLIRFAKDAKGAVNQVPAVVLNTPVSVKGDTLSYEVAQKDIPRVASYVWQFGSSSGTSDAVIDVCDQGNAANNPSGTAAPGTTVPAAVTGKLGDTLNYATGSTVTVYAVESPPVGPAAGATPPDPTYKLVLVDVKVCGPADKSTQTRRAYVFVTDNEDRNYPVKRDVTVPAHDPAFPEIVDLAAGKCQRAWVTVQIAETASPKAVIYSPDTSGFGALVWAVA